MAVKTNMSKAYDRIEWDFIKLVMQEMGFHQTWISWILQCITTVSYSFLLNGSAQGAVTPERGLRQGDPLSPFLFIICSEVLSGLCRKAQLDGSLLGLRVSKGNPRVNHLLFADDTIFFCRSDLKSCKTFLCILKKYEEASKMFGRKKRDLFNQIVDRIRQRSLSWSSRFLSTAGKTTMLKSVLASMPTYTMSCFKLLVSLVRESNQPSLIFGGTLKF
jgi:hypothetical protein